jgi:hypothetical protein
MLKEIVQTRGFLAALWAGIVIFNTVGLPYYYRAILGKTDPSALLGSPLRIASAFGLVWGAILLTGPSAGSIWVVWLALGIWVSRRFGSPRAWGPGANRSAGPADSLGMAELQSVPRLCADSR